MKKPSKKSSNVDYAKVVAQITASLDKIDKQLPPSKLRPGDKKRSAKVRRGGEAIVKKLAMLAKSHGLDSQALHSATMLAQLEATVTLNPAATRLDSTLQQVRDLQFAARQSAWASALQFYAMMRRRSLSDGALAEEMAPIVKFFGHRHESVVEGQPTKNERRARAKLRDAEALVARAAKR